MKGRQIWPLALLVLITIDPKQEIDFNVRFNQPGSGLPIQEKIDRRFSYWHQQLVNPQTKEIPKNISFKELQFSKKIPTVAAFNKANGLRLAQQKWVSTGPFNVGGRTRGLVLDITNENTIIAGGVSGGIWKSNNEGRSWQRMSSPSLRNSISCLTQDTRLGKENNWYFGTGELLGNSARSLGAPFRGDGLYKSIDNGDTWFPLGNTNSSTPDRFNNQFQYSWEILVYKSNIDVDQVYLAAYGAILKSNDGGENWDVALGEKLFDLPDTTNLNGSIAPFYTNIRQTEKGYLIATLSSATSTGELYPQAGVYFSENGEKWFAIQNRNFPTYHERTVIGLDETNDILYFFTEGDEQNTLFRYTLVSIEDGVPSGTWTNLSPNLPPLTSSIEGLDTQSGYNMLIEVHPDDPMTIFLGATNLYRSNNGFSSPNNYDWIGGYQSTSARYPGHHPDQHKVLFYPSNPQKMLTGNDGGIFKTTNNLQDSVRWGNLNNGYLTSQFYSIHQKQNSTSSNSIGGLQDNGTYLRTSSSQDPSWNRVVGGDGGYGALTDFDDLVYGSFQEGQVYRFNLTEGSSLRTFTRVDPVGGGEDEAQGYLFINPWTLDPNNQNKMYLLGGNEIWRNLNLMQIPWGSQNKTPINWQIIDNTRISQGIYTAISKPIDADILYAGFSAALPGIVKVKNPSSPTSYSTEVLQSEGFPEGGHISCIAVNPINAEEITVIFSNYEIPSIFYSTDGGESFLDVSNNLEQYEDGSGSGPSVRWLEIIPVYGTNGMNTKYFVGTSTGLYSATSPLTQESIWTKESEDLIGSSVVTMLNYRPMDGRLLVATHGNGTFATYLEDFGQITSKIPLKVKAKAFPNPFSEKINIEFTLTEDDFVKIEIYDRSGKFIRDLLWGYQFSGTNVAFWDGTNAAGLAVDHGLYFCKIITSNAEETQRILFLP